VKHGISDDPFVLELILDSVEPEMEFSGT